MHPDRLARIPKGSRSAHSAPKAEAPKPAAPEPAAPKADSPKIEAPKTKSPKTKVPKTKAPKTKASKTESPKIEESKAKAKAEEPKIPKKSLFDNDSDESDDDGGVQLQVNQEFAKRFEHNKKREERQRRMFIPVQSPPKVRILTLAPIQSRRSSRRTTDPIRNPPPSPKTKMPSSRRRTWTPISPRP